MGHEISPTARQSASPHPSAAQGTDVNGPAAKESGLFGLSTPYAEAAVVAVPVPFEATVSYRAGTARGARALVQASHQIDLFDSDFGRPYQHGICTEAPLDGVDALDAVARPAAERCIAALTDGAAADPADHKRVDDAGHTVNQLLQARVAKILADGKLPVVLGGDHSVPFGAIAACAAAQGERPLGILHLDAHCDLRVAYEDFLWSHASIMHNVIERIPNVRLVQVGIRDFCEQELETVRAQPGRITTYFDAQLRHARLTGGWLQLCDAIVGALPETVYLSFDIDGLDPTLCPNTGTPVPGGLSFDEITALLVALVQGKRKIVGLDLVEVAPAADVPDDDLGASWDANVGARLLYKMIGAAVAGPHADASELPKPPGVRA